MDPIIAAVTQMGNFLENRDSCLTTLENRTPLNTENLMARINYSVLSCFEERCIRTGFLKATWIFNRDTQKFILNRLHRNRHAKFKVNLI